MNENEIVGELHCRIEIADASGDPPLFLAAEHEAFVESIRAETQQLGRQIVGWRFTHWHQNAQLGQYETRIVAELRPL